MKVVIMAGGRGTRISSVASDIPKPMIRIDGKPVLEHEITMLQKGEFPKKRSPTQTFGKNHVNHFQWFTNKEAKDICPRKRYKKPEIPCVFLAISWACISVANMVQCHTIGYGIH